MNDPKCGSQAIVLKALKVPVKNYILIATLRKIWYPKLVAKNDIERRGVHVNSNITTKKM